MNWLKAFFSSPLPREDTWDYSHLALGFGGF